MAARLPIPLGRHDRGLLLFELDRAPSTVLDRLEKLLKGATDPIGHLLAYPDGCNHQVIILLDHSGVAVVFFPWPDAMYLAGFRTSSFLAWRVK